MGSDWTPICRKDDLIPYSGVCALHKGEQVALFYLPEQEQVFAIENHDPFSEANVIARGLLGDLDGELAVASPIYKQHFSLQDGHCLEEKGVQLRVWPVRVNEDRVWLRG